MSFRKKLNKLTAFNQAIIYAVQPETVEDSKNLFRLIQQHDDALEAYLYLQDLVPTLKGNLQERLTPEFLLEIISQIHAKAAQSLIVHTQGRRPIKLEPGEYTPVPVMRWKTSDELKNLIGSYFSSDSSSSSVYSRINLVRRMIQHAGQHNISTKGITALMQMLLEIENNLGKYPYPEHQDQYMRKTTDPEVVRAVELLGRLSYNFHRFKPEERAAVAHVVTMPVLPEYLEGAMRIFARRTCEAWKKVDASNQDAVIQLIANTFYELTSIHPFPNGNGRTSTALINLMLVTLGYPSILMRLPGDRDNSSSLYAQAIECIEEDRTLLVQHLGVRLANAAFSDAEMKDVCCLRYKIMQHIDGINERFPGYYQVVTTLIEKIGGIYAASYPDVKEIDVVRFIENILHYFLSGQDKPLNNPKYQPGLFNQAGMVERQSELKQKVIDYIQEALQVSPKNKLNH